MSASRARAQSCSGVPGGPHWAGVRCQKVPPRRSREIAISDLPSFWNRPHSCKPSNGAPHPVLARGPWDTQPPGESRTLPPQLSDDRTAPAPMVRSDALRLQAWAGTPTKRAPDARADLGQVGGRWGGKDSAPALGVGVGVASRGPCPPEPRADRHSGQARSPASARRGAPSSASAQRWGGSRRHGNPGSQRLELLN